MSSNPPDDLHTDPLQYSGMDVYAVAGNPISHSKSPYIHEQFAQQSKQSMHYGRLQPELDGFTSAAKSFFDAGGKGMNVTVPFKFEAASLATEVSERGQLAQACNVLSFDGDAVRADNTDGIGLVRDITQHAGVDLRGKQVLLIGAGGASAGVLGPLIEAGCGRIVVANRTEARAQALVARHQALAHACGVTLAASSLVPLAQAPAAETFDVVINGSASSLSGAAVPVDGSVLRPGALALDMMYGPGAQGFLDWARRHGAVPRDGLGMLVEQAAEAFFLWRGVRPPAAQVLAELRARLQPAP